MGEQLRKIAAAVLLGLLLVTAGANPDTAAFCLTVKAGPAMVKADLDTETAGADMETSLEPAPETEGGPSAELKLNAQSAALMDAGTGRILYGKEEDEKKPMASTTKIMTCILALEQGNPDDLVEVSSYAASMPDVQLNMKAGERYRLGDLLYSLMLESHNDSAAAVAEHIGGTVDGFADMMNQKARDIGCTDTCFVTPNGLDGERKKDGEPHSTTAADLARIMRYCVEQSPKSREFLEITRTASRTITDESGKRSFYLGNHNALLSMMPEALSGKTGFTGNAGYCYVAALQKEGKEFTVALLGCGWPPHKTYKWEDMRKLAGYAFENYDYYEIFEKNKTFPSLKIIDGIKEEIPLSLCLSEQEQTLKLLMRKDETPDIRYEYPREMKAPVEAGTPVGSASYYVGNDLVGSYPIYAADTVERIDLEWCIRQCLEKFVL